MSGSLLLKSFDLLAAAPGGVARLRELILTLAVKGRLVQQDARDEPAGILLDKMRKEKASLIASGILKKDKPVAEIDDDEKPFALPIGWEWARLPAVTYTHGQDTPSGKFTYIDVGAIDNLRGRITDSVQVIEAADAPSRARKNVALGTVLYSTIRPYLKNIAVLDVQYSPPAIASTAFAVMHPHGGLLSKYLLHYLRSAPFTEFVTGKAVGIAYPAINDANFFQGVIALPPSAEQSRIVARVEELMKFCDSLEQNGRLADEQHARLTTTLFGALAASESAHVLAENWERVAESFDLLLDRPEAVEALEQTITQLAVRGLLSTQSPRDVPVSIGDREQSISEIPATWSRIALEDVLLELRYGTSVKCGYEVKGKPVLRIPNLKGGAVDTADLKFGVLDEREMVKLRLKKGDILVIRSNGSASLVGSTAIVDAESEGFAFAGYLMRLRLRREFIEPSYLVLVMQTLEIRSQIEAPIRTTSGVKNINSTEVSRLAFSLPPLAEQSRILFQVAFLRRTCTDLRQQLAAARQRQSQLAQALVEQQSVATI